VLRLTSACQDLVESLSAGGCQAKDAERLAAEKNLPTGAKTPDPVNQLQPAD
jgi:hypothetical protein